jgi:hypothetical protein
MIFQVASSYGKIMVKASDLIAEVTLDIYIHYFEESNITLVCNKYRLTVFAALRTFLHCLTGLDPLW